MGKRFSRLCLIVVEEAHYSSPWCHRQHKCMHTFSQFSDFKKHYIVEARLTLTTTQHCTDKNQKFPQIKTHVWVIGRGGSRNEGAVTPSQALCFTFFIPLSPKIQGHRPDIPPGPGVDKQKTNF